MRIITTKTEAYTYNELSEQAKERALNDHIEQNEYYFLSDDMAEYLDQLLNEYKLKYDQLPKVFYDLSHSQGSGAMFEGTVFWKNYTVDIKHSGFYYHYNSKELDIYSTKTGKDAKKEVYEQFNEMYIDICNKLEKYGYGVIEYENSEENFSELCEVNCWEFTKEGKII